jgi:hypothetical protein
MEVRRTEDLPVKHLEDEGVDPRPNRLHDVERE